MKILWVKSDLLHPTTKGGHIRTLETLRRLHQRHEVHYVGFENNPGGEGVTRSKEYCARMYPVPHAAPKRTSPLFAAQLAKGLLDSLPVCIFRYRSEEMGRLLETLIAREHFDSIVCDFITPAVNFRDLSQCVVFQHNVETTIWERHAQNARNPAERLYLRQQARKMLAFERSVCRAAAHVIAVSEQDAGRMQTMFGVEDVSPIPTGVDIDYFAPPDHQNPRSGLVFVGSMDWLPNIDGIRYFCEQIYPRIRSARPDCRLGIVGREPTREIRALAERDPLVEVTGTVPDVRPYLWKAAVSIVPLRIGGGTRMKIYEAMAAHLPVVSTSVGAEGLAIHPPEDIRLADSPDDFARSCIELLENPSMAGRQADLACDLVTTQFGWNKVARHFEAILEANRIGTHSAIGS